MPPYASCRGIGAEKRFEAPDCGVLSIPRCGKPMEEKLMDHSLKQLFDRIVEIVPNRYLQTLLIILAFVLAAKIADIIMTRFLMRLFRKTSLTLDEQILEIFHKPIFVSIMLFGLALAADWLDLSQKINFVTLSGLKTVAIFMWTAAFASLLRLFMNGPCRCSVTCL
jgi:hypothetical protein